MKPVVVVLTSRFPLPLTKGDRLRAYYQIKKLATHSTVHLLSLCLTQPSDKDLEELRAHVQSITIFQLSHKSRIANLMRGLFSSMPLQVRYFYDKKIEDMISLHIAQISPDVIFTQLIRMAPYAIHLKQEAVKHLDYMDSMVLNDLGKSMFTGWRQLLIPLERSRIRKYESQIAQYFDQLYVISARDKAQFDPAIKSSIEIIPNGVDTSYFKPQQLSEDEKKDLGFSGNLSYPPNIAAAKILYTELLPHLESVTAWIAGADLDPSSSLKSTASCRVTGYIEDMRDLYRGVKVYVAPIYTGSGIQNKILEAMACGTVCITTTFVNASIQATPDEEIVIADSNMAFIEKINDLLSHPQKRQLIAQNARKFVEQNFNWDVHNQKLVDSMIHTV